jgi:hypothetical protein
MKQNKMRRKAKMLSFTTVASIRGAAGSIGKNLSLQEMREIACADLQIAKQHRRRAAAE